IVFGPHVPSCHGASDALFWMCRFPPIFLLQITLKPELIASLAPRELIASTLPVTVTPERRTPVECWSWGLPLTSIWTETHHAPVGAVRFPLTVVVLSCSFAHVMLFVAAFSVA